MKHTTKDRTLLSVAKVAQAIAMSMDVVGQKPFSRIVRLVCVLMVLIMLHITDKKSNDVGLHMEFPSSKMP